MTDRAGDGAADLGAGDGSAGASRTPGDAGTEALVLALKGEATVAIETNTAWPD